MNYDFENDRTLLRLYGIKRRSHNLSEYELSEFERLEKLYHISNGSFWDEIDGRLRGRKFIIDINQGDSFEMPDGNIGYNRLAPNKEYRITDLGNEALGNNTFMSESKRYINDVKDRNNTKKLATWAIWVSVIMGALQIVKWIIETIWH